MVVTGHTCDVWWATLSDVRPEHTALLNPIEHGRRERYVRAADRDRFTLGVAMTRLALGPLVGLPPAEVPLTRSCRDCGEPHGPPAIAGGPHVSVSHSGDRVAVALSAYGPVGIDVEECSRQLDRAIERLVLAPAEAAATDAPAGGDSGIFTYWTRKEALIKATGDGLRAPMTEITVSPPDEPPRLLAWSGRDDLVGRITMYSLDPGPGYAACLALIDQPDAEVREHTAAELLH
ncbi:MAG TPA: 4'-phosphopantetheinyl transferase superfamily protein [Streptosporangiaceae bacterium]|nr:4'-phosphopantetheinyl transferase superfamily protein [Streptosporangiaceae bacterium]